MTSLGWVRALQLHGDSPPLTRLALGLGDWSRMSWKQDAGKKTKREINAARTTDQEVPASWNPLDDQFTLSAL